MGTLIDLKGAKFGRLTVLNYAGKSKGNRALWNCVCDCGETVVVRSDELRNGDIKSCGCLNNELRSERFKRMNTIHGMAHTRPYTIWCLMRRRCNKRDDPEYKNYGGRGIKVCAEWEKDFKAFYDWAMKNGYDETAPRGQCTIDRIDVNGDYTPDNCRFVDYVMQARNKRNNKRITFNGETKIAAEWARYFGVSPSTLCGDESVVRRKMLKYSKRMVSI